MKKLILVVALGLVPASFVRADDGPVQDNEQIVGEAQDDAGGEFLAANDFEGPDRIVAGEPGQPPREPGKRGGPCGKVNLDDSQKAKIKEAMFKFRENKIDLEANLQRAHLKYDKLMANPDTDLKSAQAVSQEIGDAKGKLFAAHMTFENQVSFQILKPEQREPARFCKMIMKRHRRGHRGHGGPGDDHFAKR